MNMIPDKPAMDTTETILQVENLCVQDRRTGKNVVNNVSFSVHAGEIVCIAGIDGNGQTELIYALAGMAKAASGTITFSGENWTQKPIRYRSTHGMAHIPEDRHKHGLVLDFTLSENLALETYFLPPICHHGILNLKAMDEYAKELMEKYDIRAGGGVHTLVRSMSGGNQQKAIVAREIERDPRLLLAVQPTRGLDIGAIENIQNHLVAQRNAGRAVLLVSLELEEVMNVSDRILVIYEGEIVGELRPQETDFQELGLYMSGAKRRSVS